MDTRTTGTTHQSPPRSIRRTTNTKNRRDTLGSFRRVRLFLGSMKERDIPDLLGKLSVGFQDSRKTVFLVEHDDDRRDREVGGLQEEHVVLCHMLQHFSRVSRFLRPELPRKNIAPKNVPWRISEECRYTLKRAPWRRMRTSFPSAAPATPIRSSMLISIQSFSRPLLGLVNSSRLSFNPGT
jgi:hypothetical protein